MLLIKLVLRASSSPWFLGLWVQFCWVQSECVVCEVYTEYVVVLCGFRGRGMVGFNLVLVTINYKQLCNSPIA
jgi:hypothetical protein